MIVLVISMQGFGDHLLGLLAAFISMLGQDEGISFASKNRSYDSTSSIAHDICQNMMKLQIHLH
jgi:hypothetical protein